MRAATLLFVAALLTSTAATGSEIAGDAAPPNIVFILADDIGFGDVGAYGGRIPTPNIDSLARDGMRFTDAHSASALCAPSRFSLLTGGYPYRNGRPGGSWDINMSSAFSTGSAHLAEGRHVTVGEVLQRAGYTTGFVGKMHVGGDVFDSAGNVIRDKARLNEMDFGRGIGDGLNEHGFDYVFGLTSGIQHEPYAYFENGRYAPIAPGDPADNSSTVLLNDGDYRVGENGMSSIVEAASIRARADRNYDSSQVGRTLTSRAVNFIERHATGDRPFALYYASQAIHLPHTPPIDFDGNPREPGKPVAGTTKGATSDMIVELDLQVGALLAALERAGVLSDTLILFTSDNGALKPQVTDHGDPAHDGNGPWRGYKAEVYEGGHRVPFIVRWGDGTAAGSAVAPGSVAGQTVMNHDWVATVYDLLAQPMANDQAMDSASLLPVLLYGSEAPVHDFVIYQAGDASVGAIRQDDRVLVIDGDGAASELFDLASDPQQTRNVIAEAGNAAAVADLHATFVRHHDRDRSTFDEPRTTPPLNTPLYRSAEFEVHRDRVVQGEFEARAESPTRIVSNYPRAAHEVMFKFSLNGTENEFPPGQDQMIYLRPEDGVIRTPVYRFGELHSTALPEPVAGTASEEGPVRVTFRLDLREVLGSFEAHGEYTPPNGETIAADDFHGVYIMGNTEPLSWDMSTLRPGSDRQLHDPDGDGIYELTLTFDARYNRPLDNAGRAVWELERDLGDFPQYRSDQPIVDAIHNLSLEELEQLTRADGGIVAGARWPDVWTRDVAWGALLAVAAIAPDRLQRSLLMKVDESGRIVQDLGTGGSWPVSTDRVAWTIAAWELYAVTGDRRWLRRAYAIARRSAEADLNTAFDARTGLFRGESSFLDWREQSYPRWMQPADIYQSQSLGTNALHYEAWRVLARMARSLGEPAERYDAVADAVQRGMNEHLWQPDKGYYGQFLYGRHATRLSPRAEALGEALAVLFGIPGSAERDRLVESVPLVPFGVPSFWPYSADVPPYHNAGFWPQVGGFWSWAAARAGNGAAVEHGLATLYRAAALFLTNKENLVAQTGHFEGTELNSDRLIGSVGGSLATVYRVLLGMRFDEHGLAFEPFIPQAYDGTRTLRGFRYRKATLDIEVRGFGDAVAEAWLDGKRLTEARVPGNLSGSRRVLLVMNGALDKRDIRLTDNVTAPATPLASLTGTALAWQAVDDAERYEVYRNGERLLSTGERQVTVERDATLDTYQVAAIDESGIASFLSEPIRAISPAGVVIVETPRNRRATPDDDYVLTTPTTNTDIAFAVAVPEPGCYAVDLEYANGNGPINSGNSAALRSLFVGGSRVGALVMPHRGKRNWQARGYSNSLTVHLDGGEQRLNVRFTDADQTMNRALNDARIHHLRLTRLGPNRRCLSRESLPGATALGRQAVSLNADWEFVLQNGEGAADHHRAGAIDLPHTWNAVDMADKHAAYHRGTGHYRKTLTVPEDLRGKTLYLYFEGVNQVADVSVNGEHVAQHVGGYSAFVVDISDSVQFGADNAIDVRVSNEHDAAIPPLNADFTFYGGIYRDVWLLALDPIHFSVDEYAANEFSIDTVALTQQRATVAVRASLANRSARRRAVTVDTQVLDANGTPVAEAQARLRLPAGAAVAQQLASLTLAEPHLWSPESPYLYRVVATIRDGDTVLDTVRYPLGLRWIEVDADEGVRLNGEPYRLFGTNRHQDLPVLGNALPDGLHRRDLEIVKSNGFNFLRLAHYPQDPAVLQAADEIGLLLWEETPIVNLIDQSPTFRANSIRMVREMVRQHKHHPSVAFWGYMNEVMLREPDPAPPDYRDDLLRLAAELDDVVKAEDPTRPTVMALSRDEIDNGVPLWEIPDILAFNLYFGWYYEDFDALGAFLDAYRSNHPDTPLMVSEYGAGSDERVHALNPVSFDFSTEWQQRFHEENFRQILSRPWLIASAVWNQFDFGSNHRQDTKFAVNQKGLWYFDRTPKDVAAYYRAQLDDRQMVHIAARDWPLRAGSRAGDATMPVRVYSNAATVELTLNGESLGNQEPSNATAIWPVSLREGDNELVARSALAEDRVTIRYVDRTAMFLGNERVELAINAGGNEQIVAADSRVWEADRHYEKGSWGFIGGEAERRHRRILGTSLDPLYQTRRNGTHRYRFDVPDGAYDLELHLADLDETVGQFRILVNGKETAIDIEQAHVSQVVTIDTVADGGEGLLIELTDDTNTAFVNALRLSQDLRGSRQRTHWQDPENAAAF